MTPAPDSVLARLPLLSQNRLFLFFTAVCVVVNVLAYILYSYNRTILESQQWVNHSYEVTRQAQQTLVELYRMNGAYKNHMLLGNKGALEDFKLARRQIDLQLTVLKRLVEDDLDQQLRVKEMTRGIDALYTEMRNQTIRRGSAPVIQRTIAAEQNAIEKLRFEIEDFIGKESELLKARSKDVTVKQDDFLHILLLSAGLSIFGLLITIFTLTTLKSQKEQTEEKLAESQEQITLAMQGLNDGIYDYNVERNQIYFSRRYKDMLGYSDEELPNDYAALEELIHPDDLPHVVQVRQDYFDRKTQAYFNVFRMRHKDGRYRWILSRGQGLWDASGKIRRIVGAHTDITEQKQVEENLRHSKEELENFTYIASHDLRSPLVNLKGFASEMAASVEGTMPIIDRIAPGLPEEERTRLMQTMREDIPEALHYIQTAVSRMDRLTNAILDLQRMGKRKLRIEQLSTGDLVRRCLDVLAHEIQSKGIAVEVGALPDMRSDAVAIEQVFGNLLDNAVKFLDPARPGRIYVGGRRLHGEMLFEVTDNGRGIAEHDRERVFEFFRRASNASEIRGEGMGMAYVKSLINRLGGRIWFTSKQGAGTSFYFTISEEPSHEP